jgi:hypothetical protein
MELEFIEDKNIFYGFTIEPKDKTTFQKTEFQLHLDTSYIRFSIWVYGRCIQYLFDKNKNHIFWEQREKEIENFPIEEKYFVNGFKVIRSREVKVCDDEHKDGREYIVDRLYQNDEFQTSSTEIDLFPIDKIYDEWINHLNQRENWDNKRVLNKKKYLNPQTPKIERLAILHEEVSCEVAMLAYHPMVRDSDDLIDYPNYDIYLKSYFSKVEDKEANYIDYLKAYCEALRENIIDDMDDKEEEKFIEKYSKKANFNKE